MRSLEHPFGQPTILIFCDLCGKRFIAGSKGANDWVSMRKITKDREPEDFLDLCGPCTKKLKTFLEL